MTLQTMTRKLLPDRTFVMAIPNTVEEGNEGGAGKNVCLRLRPDREAPVRRLHAAVRQPEVKQGAAKIAGGASPKPAMTGVQRA